MRSFHLFLTLWSLSHQICKLTLLSVYQRNYQFCQEFQISAKYLKTWYFQILRFDIGILPAFITGYLPNLPRTANLLRFIFSDNKMLGFLLV